MKFTNCLFIISILAIISTNISAQSNCADAQHIPIETYATCGDMAFENVLLEGATPSGDMPMPNCGNFNANTNDMWYSFTVPSGVTEMAFHAFNAPTPLPFFGPPAHSPGMAIYTGTCGNLTEIDCFSDAGGMLGNGEIMWEIVSGLTPGETVYVRLWDMNNEPVPFFFAASVELDLPEHYCENPPELTASGCNILAPHGTIPAPDACGWTSTDNVVFYHFTVHPGDEQPYTITIEYGECWSNEGGDLFPIPIPTEPEIQLAVYSWDGSTCNGIGGGPTSDPPNTNTTTYYGCENGTGTVVYSNNLPPGQYILAMDGFSHEGGTSLCTFGFEGPGIDPDPPEPGELDVTLNTFPAGCGELGSAEIIINSSCTNNPTINWSTGDSGTSVANLTPGNHSVTITDGAECDEIIENFTITDDSFFAVNITTTGNTCTGPVTASANVDGANPDDVTFSWNTDPPLSSQTVEFQDEGTYTVVATYGTCEDTDQLTIQYDEFGFEVVYTEYFCAGTSGSAQVASLVGTGPFFFDWSTGPISQGISFSQPGQYCVTVVDSHSGCEDSYCFVVDTFPSVNVTISKEDVTCHGKNDGSATAVVTGGTPEYSYAWSTTPTTPTISQLGTGTYAVTVTDHNGCQAVATTTIEEPPPITGTITNNHGICYGEQTEIIVTPGGGTPPYSYSWNDTPVNDSVRIVSPEETTTYTVQITDNNNCTFTPLSTTVSVSAPIELDLDITDVLCNGLCTAVVQLNISGGSSPFFYHWENDSEVWQTNNAFAQNLCAGSYSVTVSDMFDCVGTANFNISEPDTIVINTFTGSPSCHGYTDGYAYIEVHGGNPYVDTLGNEYYIYNWSSAGISGDSIAIGGGSHSVTVTDANDCSHVVPFFIQQPEAIFVTNPHGGTICIGQTFTTFAHATGGTIEDNSAYNFVWTAPPDFIHFGPTLEVSPEETTTYTLHVSDDNGCYGNVRHATVNVHPPLNIIGTVSSPEYVCLGETVTVEMEVEGGNGGPYSYYFNEQTIVNMPFTFTPPETGYYTFTLRDECGTPYEKDSIFVTVHPQPHIAFYAHRTRACPPANIQFYETSENQNYSYLWSFGDGGFSVEKDPLYLYRETGLYTVSLTAWSEYGCERKITQPQMIRIFPKPRAEFTANPENASVLNGHILFRNHTDGGDYFFWDFGDGTPQIWTDEHPAHTYTEVGEFDVQLITKNQHDCYDTIVKVIRIHDEFAFYAPNAFTPNNDGFNDYFYVIGHGIDAANFHFSVYDRNGMRVHETDLYDPENPHRMAWDGTFNGSAINGDPILPNGVYVWYASFLDYTGKPHQRSGTVTLIR